VMCYCGDVLQWRCVTGGDDGPALAGGVEGRTERAVDDHPTRSPREDGEGGRGMGGSRPDRGGERGGARRNGTGRGLEGGRPDMREGGRGSGGVGRGELGRGDDRPGMGDVGVGRAGMGTGGTETGESSGGRPGRGEGSTGRDGGNRPVGGRPLKSQSPQLSGRWSESSYCLHLLLSLINLIAIYYIV